MKGYKYPLFSPFSLAASSLSLLLLQDNVATSGNIIGNKR